jgi:hypothetical protein
MWDLFKSSFVAAWHNVAESLPSLLFAFVILIAGWLIALFIAKIISAVIRKTSLDNKLSGIITDEEAKRSVHVETWLSKGVYYFLMLIVLAAFFQQLGLTATTSTFSHIINKIVEYLPNLCIAVIFVLAAWVIANFLRALVTGSMSITKLDEKLADEEDASKSVPVSKTIGEAIYWLVFLLFVPLVLDILHLEGLLGPVQEMFNEIFSYVPNLLVALMVLVVGWFVARVFQKIITNFLLAAGSEQVSDKVGLKSVLGQKKLAHVIGLIVYVLILIPVLIAALDALNVAAITEPFSDMLKLFLSSIPIILASAVILLIAYFAGSVLAELASKLLSSFGFDSILTKLGINKESSKDAMAPSAVIGKLVHVGIMFLAAMVACGLLGFDTLEALIQSFLFFAGRVVLAVVIFMVGIYLANLAAAALKGKGMQSEVLSFLARIGILIFAGAVALRHVGLANEIINLAFGLLLGAIAVAIAISFGVGGREFAARKLEEWEKSIKEKK